MIRGYLDIECYVNYFLVMILFDDGRHVAFEKHDDQELDTAALLKFLEHPKIEFVTFNGRNYDEPMVKYALGGASCAQLKAASDDIIQNNLKPWDFVRKYPSADIELNQVDLIEVAPGMVSLKLYGGRLHAPKLQDLPIAHDASIDPDQRPLLRRYCKNDLTTTKLLYVALEQQVDLRRHMGSTLGEDLRSKSDAQIAEAVLKRRIRDAVGVTPRKWPIAYGSFQYEPPPYVQFGEPVLKHALEVLRGVTYHIKPDTGHIVMPPEVDALDIRVGNTQYKIGIGGLHSQESEVSHYAGDDTILCDIDVRSYYPNLMLNMGMYPDSMGPHFLDAYRAILVERLASKDRAGQIAKRIAELEKELALLC